MLDFSKILGTAKKLREQKANLNQQNEENPDYPNLEKMPRTVETPTVLTPEQLDYIRKGFDDYKNSQKYKDLNSGLEKMPTTMPEPTFPNKEKTPGTSIPVTRYITDINNGLTKLVKSGKIFSPVQQRKIAKLYTNARNKYKTSSQSEEETNAFNALKSNPIWRSFNNNK